MRKIGISLLLLISLSLLVSCTSATVDISFTSADGEIYKTIEVEFDALAELTFPTPEKIGHEFVGWYTDSEFTSQFDVATVGKHTKKLTLYPKFTPKEYTVTLRYRDCVSVETYKYGEEISIYVPAQVVGLYSDTEYTIPYELPSTMPAENIVVYAKCIGKYTVSASVSMDDVLTLTGGSLLQSITEANDTHTPIVVSDVKYGYRYVGYEVNGQRYTDTIIDLGRISADTEILIIADYATYELPIINIDTAGVSIENKYDYVDMTFSITNTADELDGVTGGVRYRGNSTYSFSKKPYRIKFDKKQSLFGLDKAKSWVLLADYLDPTGLKNHTAFSIADEAGFRFVATTHKVNLYLNGEYIGLFTLCEQMQENEGRIDIEKDITEDMTNLFDFNFFIAMDGKVLEDAEAVMGETYFYLSEYDRYVELKYPEKEAFVSEEQFESFFNQLQEYMEDIFYMFDTKDAEAIKAACNVDSLVNFTIIDQIMGENDHARNSFNMFYTTTSDNVAENGKLNFGPIWDYDSSLHTAWTREPDVLFELSDNETYSNVFLKAVHGISEFATMRNEKWHSYFAPRLTEYLSEYDALVDSMRESLELNAAMWYTNPEKHPEGLLENSITHLKAFLQHRLELFNEKWALDEE